MKYKKINLNTRLGDSANLRDISRTVGIECWSPETSQQYVLSEIGWSRFEAKTPNRSFKMDFAVERIANGFKSLFTAFLKSTHNTKNILVFEFSGFFVIVKNSGGSVVLNGQTMTRTIAARHLSALCFQSKDHETREEVRDKFFRIVSIPPDVNYAIMNRAPYAFYYDGKYIKCRLNVRQISSNEIALEISDGVWGTITIKQFVGYLSHYLHGTQRGSWVYTSPEKLYERVMGSAGRISDIKVMKNFLIQNRTSALVNKRAEELLKQVTEEYPGKVKHFCKDNSHVLFVKGIENDWAIYWTTRNNSGMQLVTMSCKEARYDADKNEKKFDIRNGGKGFITLCVDNLQKNSPQVDQAVSRVLVALNDKSTKEMVSTMRGIPISKFRIDFDSLRQEDYCVHYDWISNNMTFAPLEEE